MTTTIAQLRHFIALARAGSFVKASDVLCMTQPALSRSIKSLEDQLGQRRERSTRHSPSASAASEAIPYSEFVRQVDEGNVRSVTTSANTTGNQVITGKLSGGEAFRTLAPADIRRLPSEISFSYHSPVHPKKRSFGSIAALLFVVKRDAGTMPG